MESTPSSTNVVTTSVVTTSAVTIGKILQILTVLEGRPSCDTIYQQATQLLVCLQQGISKNENAYAGLARSLLTLLRQMLPEHSDAGGSIEILQLRLGPPLLEADIDAISVQLQHLARQLDGVYASAGAGHPEESSRPGVSGTGTGYAELSLKAGARNRQGPARDESARSFYGDIAADDEVPGAGEFYTDVVSTEDKDSLTRELRDAIDESRECGLLLSKALESLHTGARHGDVASMRDGLLSQLNQLQHNQALLTRNLEKTHHYLSSVETSRRHLDKELNRARLLSLTDELTELPNRRAFLNRLEDEVGRTRRHKLPLAMAIIDLDGFKKVNDTHGHSVGDEVLRCYAREIFSTFRQYDLVARYGGEEFAVLFPNTDRNGAICALRKVQKRVEEARIKFQHDGLPIPSFSAGLAVYQDDESLNGYIERADQAMYRAKSMGRDRIEVDAA